MHRLFTTLIGICLLFTSCSIKKSLLNNKINRSPKNVILLISDGTGLSQISSAYFFKGETPNYSRFKTIGLIRTSSSIQDITDSAASATAIATGKKTYNGAIGVALDSTLLTSITEIADSKDIMSGIVATSSITHATPASFYAHVFNRNMQENIALDLTESNLSFFAGGGLKFFENRKDSIQLLKSSGFSDFYIGKQGLDQYEEIMNYNRVGYLLADNEMPKMLEGRGNFLANATSLAIKFLGKNNKSFFIMSEGSQIDWGGHQNDADYLITELLDFDYTIGKVLDFAEKDGNTLVIVTSDHETGGFTLSGRSKTATDGTKYVEYQKVGTSFSNTGHSATLIPVFAFGPGEEIFKGIYENNEIFDKILMVTGWGKQ